MPQINIRRYLLFTHGFFLLLAAFSIYFANERFQADGAYYLFKIINYEKFQIEHQRYILIFSQAIPLLGIKLGLSLKAIIVLNSLSNPIFFYLIFAYVVFRLRDYTGGVAVILFQVVGVMHLQFTPMYEIWYGAVLLIPLRSHLITNRFHSFLDWLILSALIITILFSHPLLFIPLLFILFFTAVEYWIIHWRMFVAVIGSFVVWYLIKKIFLTEYESGKMSMISTSTNDAWKNLLQPGYYWKLTKFFFSYYTVPTISLIFSLLFYLVRRARIKAILVSGFFIGHILIVNFTHTSDFVISPYFERMYMPLVAISIIPFLYDIFTQFTLSNIVGGILLTSIILWRIWLFVSLGMDYRERTKQQEQIIATAQKQSGTKFLLHQNDLMGCMSYAEWSLPMETMLYSARAGKEKTVSIATWPDMTESNNQEILKDNSNKYIMRRWEIMPDNVVNGKYFLMKEGFYQELPAICK
jgi:hypothetical protein